MRLAKIASSIHEYESGKLEHAETIKLFQSLVESGLAWTLQGHYGRVAVSLIEAGEIAPPQGGGEHVAL